MENIEENQANKNGDTRGHTMDELNRVIDNQNMQIKNERVKDDPEMPILSFRHVFMSHLTESEPLISSQVSRKQPIRSSTQVRINLYRDSINQFYVFYIFEK